jgi:CSLREA domain-containing protein
MNLHKLFAHIAMVITLVCISAFANAATLTVTSTDDDLSDDDDCTLREAVANVNNDTAIYDECGEPDVSGSDEIVLSAGTFCLTSELELNKDMTVRGDGSSSTILDGGNHTDSSSDCSASSNRVIKVGVAGFTIALEGMTVMGGKTAESGGGIWVENTTNFSLSDVILKKNTITSPIDHVTGGGIHVEYDSTLTVDASEVNYNAIEITGTTSYDGYGAGIYISYGSTLTVSDSTVTYNTITAETGAGLGAGIMSYSETTSTDTQSTITITGSEISNNEITTADSSSGFPSFGGAGLYMMNSLSVSVSDSQIKDNTVSTAGYAFAGGVFLYYCDEASFTNSTVSGNIATTTENDSVAGGGGAGTGRNFNYF